MRWLAVAGLPVAAGASAMAWDLVERWVAATTPAQRLDQVAAVTSCVAIYRLVALVVGFGKKWRTPAADRYRIAVHESGHAAALLASPSAALLNVRLTLDGVLQSGLTSFALKKRPTILDERDLKSLITVALAGRAAEHELLGMPTVGASEDLRVARAIAAQYVDLLEAPFVAMASPRRARSVCRACYAEARRFVRRNRDQIHALADELFHGTVLTAAQAKAIVAKPPAHAGPPSATLKLRLRDIHRLARQLASTFYVWSNVVALCQSQARLIEQRQTKKRWPWQKQESRKPSHP